MQTQVIANIEMPKVFLWIDMRNGSYVSKISCTDEEIAAGELARYEVDPTTEYSLYTASSYVGERFITNIEVGDMLELDTNLNIMRIA